MMKRVAAIHDLSCYSKSSLTVVLPVLAALGLEAAALPTALLSTQTDGFSNYYYLDLTSSMVNIIEHWQRLNLRFDAIYSGFLGSQEQVSIVEEFITWQRKIGEPLVVVDPVLGDSGEAYGPISAELIEEMGHLVALADVITPNPTEAALLLAEPYAADLNIEQAISSVERLAKLGPKQVALTGVLKDGGGSIVSYDRTRETFQESHNNYAPLSYPGSGDLFASILTALLVHSYSFNEAVSVSGRLTSQAVICSYQEGRAVREGVAVELIVPQLATLEHP